MNMEKCRPIAFGGVPLDALGAQVPAGDVPLGIQQEDGVVAHVIHQAPESLLMAAGREEIANNGAVEGHGAGRFGGAFGQGTLLPAAGRRPGG